MSHVAPSPQDAFDPIRSARTFPQLLRAVAVRYGEAPAIALGGDGVEAESLSFAGLERASAELARALLAQSAGKGTRIGIIAGNGPFFALTFAAVARMGGIVVPISTTMRADELVRVLRRSDVSGLIVQRRLLGTDYAQRLVEALPDLGIARGTPKPLESLSGCRFSPRCPHSTARCRIEQPATHRVGRSAVDCHLFDEAEVAAG